MSNLDKNEGTAFVSITLFPILEWQGGGMKCSSGGGGVATVVATAERVKKKKKEKKVLSVKVPKPRSGPRRTHRQVN